MNFMNFETPVIFQQITNNQFSDHSNRFNLNSTVKGNNNTQSVELTSSPSPSSIKEMDFTHQSSSPQQSSFDDCQNQSDFSFLNKRPPTFCSKVVQHQYQMRNLQRGVRKTNVSSSSKQSLKKSGLVRNRSSKKIDSTVKNGSFSESMSRTSSQATIVKNSPGSKSKSIEDYEKISFSNVKKLPLRLPEPPITFISDPHVDLPGHLIRHGLLQDANEFAKVPSMPVQFALHQYMRFKGPIDLLKSTSLFMETFQSSLNDQLVRAQAEDEALPRYFSIPTEIFKSMNGSEPTHVFAIHGNQQGGESKENGILIPCHALLYALQCVSLPRFGESNAKMVKEESSDGSDQFFPVVPIIVPRPKEFAILHRFIYTRNAAGLLMELLPMKRIATYANDQQIKSQCQLENGFAEMDLSSIFANSIIGFEQPLQFFPVNNLNEKTVANYATESLSNLTVNELFTLAYRVNSVWANGVAIGLINPQFWNTLNKAWTLILTALGTKKGRYIDVESRGLNIGLKKVNE